MIVRTAMVVDMGDGRKEYVDSKVYNVIMHKGYQKGREEARAEAFDEFINYVKTDYEFRVANIDYTDTIIKILQCIAEELKEQKHETT